MKNHLKEQLLTLFKNNWLDIGHVWFYTSQKFKDFDDKNFHPKLIFDKKGNTRILVPGTSQKKTPKSSIKVNSELFWKGSKKEYTYFVYKFRRGASADEIYEKGEYSGGGHEIKELIDEYKKNYL